MSRPCDVAIVGAGPYGLAAASRIRRADGLDVRIFGDPMSFWRSMPAGMLLRSSWEASSIGYRNGELSLDAYRSASGAAFGAPVPLERFVEYGSWFQRAVAPDVDHRAVDLVGPPNGAFRLRLEDGDEIAAKRVVVAAGIGPFARRPDWAEGLSPELVSHASDHADLARFAGQRVLVVGGGQSALESAALLHEGGAEVEVVARSNLTWLKGGTIQRALGPAKPFFYAPTDVGPMGMSRLLAAPGLFCLLPRALQDRMARRAIRPAGAKWLVPRLESVPLTIGRNVVSLHVEGDEARVGLDDGSERVVDHVMLGTGYAVDIARYPFLAPELVSRIERAGGFPLLGAGLESSVPGLHFVGAPAAWSYGPIMRFVSGTWFAARTLARGVVPSRPRRLR